MTSSVQSLEVSYFIQMTEDEEKVRRAVAGLVGAELSEERQEAEGHFGNKIWWIRQRATGDEAEAALGAIVRHLGPGERAAILRDLSSATDEHHALYVRLSKQVLIMRKEAVLTNSDPIRVRVKPRSFLVRGDPQGFYTRLFEEWRG